MCHNGDARLDDGLDTVGILHAALKLHGLAVRFLHNTSCVAYGVFDGCLIRHKGHVNDDESLLGTPADGLAMVDHVLDGDGQCVLIAQHDIAEGVAHQDHVNSCLINRLGSMKVIGCQHTHGEFSLTA